MGISHLDTYEHVDRVYESVADPLQTQVNGDHYRTMKIQPVEFIHSNEIGFMEGCAIKYLSRHRSKGQAGDIKKAIHFCQLILKLEYGE
jgi:hypothetical protein